MDAVNHFQEVRGPLTSVQDSCQCAEGWLSLKDRTVYVSCFMLFYHLGIQRWKPFKMKWKPTFYSCQCYLGDFQLENQRLTVH